MSNTLSPWFSLDTTLFITSGLPTLGPHSSAEHCEIANRKTDTEIRNKNERFNSLRWLQIPCAIATDGRPCFPLDRMRLASRMREVFQALAVKLKSLKRRC